MWQYYPWVRFIHIIAGFTFMMAHGASVALSFRLKKEYHLDYFQKEHHLERVQAYLDLAGQMWTTSMTSLLVLIVSGVTAGFMGSYWDKGWIWASLIILFLMTIWMQVPTREIHDLRQAVGMSYRMNNKQHPADPPQKIEDITHLLETTHPYLTTAIGYGGTIIIIYLMVFKPF